MSGVQVLVENPIFLLKLKLGIISEIINLFFDGIIDYLWVILVISDEQVLVKGQRHVSNVLFLTDHLV